MDCGCDAKYFAINFIPAHIRLICGSDHKHTFSQFKFNHFDSTILPKINFFKFDDVLQRQFYTRCFPIIRRKFQIFSKTLSKLGKKPITYLALGSTFGVAGNYPVGNLPENAVIITFDCTIFRDCKLETFKTIRKFIEFKHVITTWENSKIDSQTSKIIPNLTGDKMEWVDYRLDNSVFHGQKMLNNLKFYNNLRFGWENILLQSGLQLETVKCKNQEEINDFQSLSLFMKKQKPDFYFKCTRATYTRKQLTKYFHSYKDHMGKRPILHLMVFKPINTNREVKYKLYTPKNYQFQ